MPAPGQLSLPSQPLTTQIANKAAWNEARRFEAADFFTIGYMRRDVADLISALQWAGVETLIDVRQHPVSQFNPQFSKRNLREALVAAGIQYIHLPELGVPRDVRALAIGQDDRNAIWDWYDEQVAQVFAGVNLTQFFNGADHPVAFMCMELDPTACHRHRLAVALERHGLRGYDL